MTLSASDLMSLEVYARQRPEFRQRVMAHKQPRRIAIGPDVKLYFEDRLTIQYQIQEMLRVERIFEPEGIADELAAYNPLIPDGSNWKATMMIEYPAPEERKRQLQRLVGIERKTWIQVDGGERVSPICDEDLAREDRNKTSSVHFLRFELSQSDISLLKQGAHVKMGIDHPHYRAVTELTAEQRLALLADLD